MSTPTFVYVMACGDEHTKIGLAKDLRRRLAGLQACCPMQIRLISSLEFADFPTARAIEAELHRTFADYRGFGEWFSIKPDWAKSALFQKMHLSSAAPEDAAKQLGLQDVGRMRAHRKRRPELWVVDEDEDEDA